MKKKILLSLILIISLLGLTACSRRTNNGGESPEDITTAIIKSEAIVSLDEDGKGIVEEIIEKEDISEKNMSETKEKTNSEITKETTVIPVDAMEYKLYVPNNDHTGYNIEEYIADNKDDVPEQIIRCLKGISLLHNNVEVQAFDINDNKCTIDLSEEFVNNITKNDGAEEELIVCCIVNSIIDSYLEVDSVKITVNGESFSTEHKNYEDYLTKH